MLFSQLVIGLAMAGQTAAPTAAQTVPAGTTQPVGQPGTTATRPLPAPPKVGEKQGFIRRQVGRDVNPDQPDPAANPLPRPPKPGAGRTQSHDDGEDDIQMARPGPVERQGFIRRQVGRDVNPDQVQTAPLAPPTGRAGLTQPPAATPQTAPKP